MSVLSIFNLSKSYGNRILFDNVDFSINKGKKVALLGENGKGKTTILEIICGNTSQDDGSIIKAKDAKISYMKQIENPDETVNQFMLREFADLIALEKQIEDETNPSKIDYLMHRYENEGGHSFRSEIRSVLKALAFTENFWERKLSQLSGGQVVRLKLARVLSSNADILVLDEPTNHLDLTMISWLENMLRSSNKTILFVSHDRKLIEFLAEEILLITKGGIEHYKNGYNNFILQHKQKNELAEITKENLEEKSFELKDFINKYRAGIKSKQVQSRMNMLSKIESELSAFKFENRTISIQFKKKREENDDVLKVNNVSIGYKDNILSENISFTIHKGEKTAIIGPNGVGKTTFIKSLIDGKGRLKGDIHIGERVDIGYFGQNFENINKDSTILDELYYAAENVTLQHIYDLIPKFGMTFDDLQKDISILSGGELSKVSFMKLILQQPNFLILDEPTNHLDIETVEKLKSALSSFKGTVLMVSHDRYFIEGLSDKIILFQDKQVTVELPPLSSLLKKMEKTEKQNKSEELSQQQKTASKPRPNKFKIDKVNNEILTLENELNFLYSERDSEVTDWNKINIINEKISECENTLLLKYEEKESLEA